MGDWTLLSNHGHVLVCLYRNNAARLRDVSSQVGITERAVQKIVRELQQAGLITISKHGRCNRYRINGRKNLRHELEAHCSIGRLLQLMGPTGKAREARGENADERPAAAVSPSPAAARSAGARPAAEAKAPNASKPPAAADTTAEQTPRTASEEAPPAKGTSAVKPVQPAPPESSEKSAPGGSGKDAQQSAGKAAASGADKQSKEAEDDRQQGSLF